jgi:hypothetical protein
LQGGATKAAKITSSALFKRQHSGFAEDKHYSAEKAPVVKTLGSFIRRSLKKKKSSTNSASAVDTTTGGGATSTTEGMTTD